MCGLIALILLFGCDGKQPGGAESEPTVDLVSGVYSGRDGSRVTLTGAEASLVVDMLTSLISSEECVSPSPESEDRGGLHLVNFPTTVDDTLDDAYVVNGTVWIFRAGDEPCVLTRGTTPLVSAVSAIARERFPSNEFSLLKLKG